MFVLTTDLAGLEFPLDRASAVIGRTDENDIVLGHRSISRHHAKIVRDGDHYTIVDLQSANGVRVNGEDYERIELNPGDIVELGHVKLRFVGPFETFVFRRRRPGVRLPQGRRRRRDRLAAARGCGGGAPQAKRGRGARRPVVAVAPDGRRTAAAARARAGGRAGTGARARGPATPAAIFAEARQAVGVEDWDKARATLDQIASVDDLALRRDVAALGAGSTSNARARCCSRSSTRRRPRKNTPRRWVGTNKSRPTASTSAARRHATTRRARCSSSEHMAAADRARTAGQCADVKTEVAEIIRLEPRNTIAREMVRLCRPRAAAAAPVAARPAKPRPSPTLTATDAPHARRATRAGQARGGRPGAGPRYGPIRTR